MPGGGLLVFSQEDDARAMRLCAIALILASGLVAQDLARLQPAGGSRGEIRELADAARAVAWEARTAWSDLLFLEADLLWHGEDPAGMEAKLLAATRLNPQFVEAWLLVSWQFAYNRAEEEPQARDLYIDRALEILDRALAANPGHPELLSQKAWILYQRRRDWRAAQDVLARIQPGRRTVFSDRLSARVKVRQREES